MILRWVTITLVLSISMSLHSSARLLQQTKSADVVPSGAALSHKKYNEVTWLTAHNAYSYYWRYKTYAQQWLNLKEQWAAGVRAFMVDIYWSPTNEQRSHHFAVYPKLAQSKQHLLLCHGGYGLTKYLMAFQEPQSFASWLEELNSLLDENPTEITTIIIESKSGASFDNTQAAKEARQGVIAAIHTAGLSDKLFIPQGYNKRDHIIDWPSIGEMITTNQRLVVFSDNVAETGTIYTTALCENSYNLAAPNPLQLRTDNRSENAHLAVFNHFYKFSLKDILYRTNNVEKIRQQILTFELLYGITPNFIALNFITAEGKNKVQSIQSLIREMNLSTWSRRLRSDR